MKTIAAVLTDINKRLRIEELSLPELKSGQVLVRLAYSGLCHSQLNEIKGLKGKDKFLPHTLGHEGSGIVEEIGAGVRKVKEGDHVVLTWIKGLGADVPLAIYTRKDKSIVNSGAISTFMTRSVISENRLVKVKKYMPLREAALLGCAIPTGAGIVLNTAKVSPGSTVAVFGIGGIGMSAVMTAKLRKAAVIIAVDVVGHKLRQAKRIGATHIINARKEDVLSAVMRITGLRGLDYAIEAAGKRESMELAFSAVRDKGGLCVIAGNLPQGSKISIDPFDLIKGKQIIGTWGGETQPDRDIPRFADLFISGNLKLDGLVGQVYRLEDINKAFRKLEEGKEGRLMIRFS